MQEPQDLFSTLEFVKHDTTTDAPERDHNATAPEVVQAFSALQASPESRILVAEAEGIEPFRNGALPEVVDSGEKEAHYEGLKRLVPNTRPRKRYWTIALSTLSLVIILGISIGLGIGLHGKPVVASMPANMPTNISNSSSLSSDAHNILDDTSFAATATADGNYHTFFQEISGAIRQIIHVYATGAWSVDATNVVATNAKLHSPMSTIYLSNGPSTSASDEIHLFYVSENGSIDFQIYELATGLWGKTSGLYSTIGGGSPFPPLYAGISSFSTINDSRALSATLRFNDSLNTIGGGFGNIFMYLLYENTDGNPTWLVGSYATSNTSSDNYSDFYWNWIDLTGKLALFVSSSTQPETIISGPQSMGTDFPLYPGVNDSSFLANADLLYDICITFAVILAPSNSYPTNTSRIMGHCYNDTSFDYAITFSLGLPFSASPYSTMDFTQGYITNTSSSLNSFLFYVNGTKLESSPLQPATSEGPPISPPLSPFPFTRLANTVGLTADTSQVIYLYHQINETTIAEDQWDIVNGKWTSNSITVAID
ncbi:hypothetical protein MMC17_007425 [Xylographa soralifera]|nr:hypothetical protein [Xylographa soralifera]